MKYAEGNCDLLTSIIIRLSRTGKKGESRILNLLQDLFSGTLTESEKKEKLKEYGIEIEDHLGKESAGKTEEYLKKYWDM